MLIRLTLLALLAVTQAAPRYYTAPGPIESMRGKQAVLDTSMGTIVMELLPDLAPNQVALFIKLAGEGVYTNTAFHRVVRYGIIQGGDPLTKDLSKHTLYGRGGFNQVRLEPNKEKLVAGMVAAIRLNGQKDSAGAQFFICVSNQTGLEGQHTPFARVVDGLEVAAAISAVSKDPDGTPIKRVVLNSVTIRDTPVEPFVSATVEEMAQQKAVIETTMGVIEIEMMPDKAPETVRSFLRWASAGVYDGIRVHRVVPNFVIQTGALAYRTQPLKPAQQKLIHNLAPEFTNTPNVVGTVSIARSEEPGSGSTSFFICIGECKSLENKYTVFGKVLNGMNVVNTMSNVPVDGEKPRLDILVKKVTIVSK